MRLPRWPRRWLRRRNRRVDVVRQRLMEPVRLSLRRLEERRVLNASAVFTMAGELSLQLSGAAEAATISADNGNIVVRDANQNIVNIQDDVGAATTVGVSQVQSLAVTGDAAVDQLVQLDVALSPVRGVTIDASIETAVISQNITAGEPITIGANLVLTNDVSLTASAVVFEGRIDGPFDLELTATDGRVAFSGNVGDDAPLGSLRVVRAADGVVFGETSAVARVQTTGPIDLGTGSNVLGDVTFNAGDGNTLMVTTTGDQVRINGAVTLDSHLRIDTGTTGGDVIFTSAAPIDSQAGETNDLTLTAGKGGVFFQANLGQAESIGRFQIQRADGGVTFGGQVPVTLIRVAGGLDLGVGSTRIGGAGITLDGGAAALAINVTDGDARFNGQLTLASDVAITVTNPPASGLGDIIFTSDTPIDSTAGEMNQLRLDAGSHAIRFNEDIGGTHLLGSLIVDRAEGGVAFGESITEIPGSGGRGPVDRLNVRGPIDVGVGFNVVRGGIVLTGGAVDGMLVSTDAGNMRFNGPVILGNSVRLETGSGGGDISFTHDASIDSLAGRTSDLSLDAGMGSVSFNENLGEQNSLGRLTIERADVGVQFGGASAVGPTAGGMGPVSIVHARLGIDVGAVSTIGGAGIDVNGGDAPITFMTDNQTIRFNGDLDLQSSARFETSAGVGNVIFTSATPIDSSDGPELATAAERNSLTVDAGLGQVVFHANLGETQQIDRLTIERAASGVVFGGADAMTTAGTGPVTSIATDGSIDIGAGDAPDNVITGGIIFNGGGGTNAALLVTTSGDLVRLNGPITAASKLTIDTSGGDIRLTAAASLNSQADESNDVMIDLGDGDGTFDGAIGDTGPLGAWQILAARNLTFNGAIKTVASAGVNLTGANISINAPVTTTGGGRVTIQQTGLLKINHAATMRLDGAFMQAGGAVETAADISTSGDAISFGGAVMLTGGPLSNVHLDTTADGNSTGAMVSFASTLDGQAVDPDETIHINAGTEHDIIFGAAIGGGLRVGTLHVIEARDVTFSAAVVVGSVWQEAGQGTTTFLGTIDANSPVDKAVDVATVQVTFADAVRTQGDGRVEITVSGWLDIGAAAHMNLSGSFVQDGGGTTRTSANILTSDDDVRFTDAVMIGGNVSIDTGSGGGGIFFEDSLDGSLARGQHPRYSSGSGDIRFSGPVGEMTPLGDIVIVAAGNVTFEAVLRSGSLTQQSGSGETRFADTVMLTGAAGLDVVTGSVHLDGNVDTAAGNGPLRVATAEDITVNAALTSGGGAVTLLADHDVTITAIGAILTDDAVVSITADADDSLGGSVDMLDGATVRTGAAAVDVSAGGDIRLGSLITTDVVAITSRGGGIVDHGDADGFDIVADRVALRARRGIGTDNPIDIRVHSLAARNLAEGGIRVDNRIDGLLTIGAVDGLTGITAGPDVPADLGGDIEISHVGSIDVNAAIQNNAGGHTIVRAETAGNLNVNQPIQNRGGDGWIMLFAGADLVIQDSLPEFIDGDPGQLFPEAEISVQNAGAIRGQAQGRVFVDNSPTNYAIIRTHAERPLDPANVPPLPPKFSDPAAFPQDDPEFYAELDAFLELQRNTLPAQITNVAPIFAIESVDQGGSNLDEKGRGILMITIGDEFHLERNFQVTVDWGDGNIENYPIPGNPQASIGFILDRGARSNLSPDATITASFDSGELQSDGTRTPGVYFIHHTYLEPPDLGDPAAPIPVMAELRYDARSEGEISLDIIQPAGDSEIFDGILFLENLTQEIFSVDSTVMTNPGQGAFAFIKVIESEIIPVELRKVVTAVVSSTTVSSASAFGEQLEAVATQFEAQTFGDYRLFFQIIDDITGDVIGEFNLPNERLADPITVFTRDFRFPNGHYRVFLEDLRTKRSRMILEVHIYEGRVVPPNFRQGATERQPGSDAVEEAGAGEQPVPADRANDEQPVPADGAAGDPSQNSAAPVVAWHRAGEDAPLPGAAVPGAAGTDNAPPAASATLGGAAAWLALQPRIRRRLKMPGSNLRRLDQAARIARRLRDKFKP